MQMLEEWMFDFLDAIIAGDYRRALHIAYQNEGEQIRFDL